MTNPSDVDYVLGGIIWVATTLATALGDLDRLPQASLDKALVPALTAVSATGRPTSFATGLVLNLAA
ncbi:MAG: hypothetical protein FJ029_10190 [Actinobacteria bacterium]|nr:hypothetical protein [Actinomycetota bacterium]